MNSILTKLIDNRFSPIKVMADAWLSSGAASFSLWSSTGPIISYPDSMQDFQPDMVEKIILNGKSIGELRIAGIHTKPAKLRLQAEARLLSSIVPFIQETNRMANDLIEARNQMLALYDLAISSRNCLETEQMLNHLAYETNKLMNTEGAFVLLNLPDKPIYLCQNPEGMIDQAIVERYLRQVRAGSHLVVQEGNNYRPDPTRFRNLLLLPFSVRGATTAAVGVINKLDSDFTSSDIKLLKMIAEYGGAEIENILLIEQNMEFTRLQAEMDVAQQIQVSLLPKESPKVPQLDIWGVSYPAQQVGGDFFDFFDRLWNPFTFVIGDIAGKGLPAAMLMAITRTVIRTETNTRLYMTPASLLKSANFELYDDFNQLGLFATLFIGQYQFSTHELYYANAGHSPVVYCPAGGIAQLLQADGTAIGILPDLSSFDQKIQLSPGDLVVVGTDGLVEARDNHDHRFGYDRFLHLIESVAHKPAREIVDSVFQELESFCEANLREDDQTLLAFKYLGQET